MAPEFRSTAKRHKWPLMSVVVTLGGVGLSIVMFPSVPRDAPHEDHFALALAGVASIQRASFVLVFCGLLGSAFALRGLVETRRRIVAAVALVTSIAVAVVGIVVLLCLAPYG